MSVDIFYNLKKTIFRYLGKKKFVRDSGVLLNVRQERAVCKLLSQAPTSLLAALQNSLLTKIHFFFFFKAVICTVMRRTQI
jgi:hypothetical protein